MEWVALIIAIVTLALIYKLKNELSFYKKATIIDIETIIDVLVGNELTTRESLKENQMRRWTRMNMTPEKREKLIKALRELLKTDDEKKQGG